MWECQSSKTYRGAHLLIDQNDAICQTIITLCFSSAYLVVCYDALVWFATWPMAKALESDYTSTCTYIVRLYFLSVQLQITVKLWKHVHTESFHDHKPREGGGGWKDRQKWWKVLSSTVSSAVLLRGLLRKSLRIFWFEAFSWSGKSETKTEKFNRFLCIFYFSVTILSKNHCGQKKMKNQLNFWFMNTKPKQNSIFQKNKQTWIYTNPGRWRREAHLERQLNSLRYWTSRSTFHGPRQMPRTTLLERKLLQHCFWSNTVFVFGMTECVSEIIFLRLIDSQHYKTVDT